MAMLNMLHACLRVENLEKSIEFYEKAFGFKEDRRKDFPEHKFTIVYLTLPGESFEIELTYNYGHGPYTIGDGFHIWQLLRTIWKEIMKSIRQWDTRQQILWACLVNLDIIIS